MPTMVSGSYPADSNSIPAAFNDSRGGRYLCIIGAILDNLTTTIVMVSLIAKKLLSQREDRLVFAGMIVIAANAGGAWSPIGDVTTTMLWIGGQITPLNVVTSLIVPSLVNAFIPLALVVYQLRGRPVLAPLERQDEDNSTNSLERNLVFFFWA